MFNNCTSSKELKGHTSEKYVALFSQLTELKEINQYFLQIYAFEETEDGCEPRFKWYRKRRIADKMYEFCSDDDENMENICPRIKMRR